jgi:V/A-type H+/Na+-transporting ATPase subunit E
MDSSTKTSSGVQQLIDRLHNEGVTAGQKEGDQIIEEAKRQAAKIIADAKHEAETYHTRANVEIQREKESAKAALQMAARDTVLKMRSEVAQRFQVQVRRLVTEELRDKDFLRRLILEIAGKSMPAAEPGRTIEILVSNKPEIDKMVREITTDMLREGIEIKPAGGDQSGIRARIKGEDVEVDMTDKTIADALVRHLLPRFRYIAQGIQEPE